MTTVAKDGYRLEKNVFSLKEIKALESIIQDDIHNIYDTDYPKQSTCSDAVNKHPQLFTFVSNPNLLSAVRNHLKNDIKFIRHNDIHSNVGAFPLHRDSINRSINCVGDNWETPPPYYIVRVAIYTRPYTLKVIPQSHIVSGRIKKNSIGISTNPGDVIIFDARLLHAATPFNTPKYAAFFCYAQLNQHTHKHWHYYLHTRKDLSYSKCCNQLKSKLEEMNLFYD